MSRTTLKSYFESGDEPTEEQLAELIDESLNLPDDSVEFVGDTVVITNKDHPMYGESVVNPAPGNIVTFLKAFFFPFDPATISINSGTTYIELGVENDILITGVVTKNSETIFNNAHIFTPPSDTSIHSWIVDPLADDPPYSYTDPAVVESKNYRARIDVDNNGTPGIIYSDTKSIVAVIPWFHGANPTQVLDSTIYTNPNFQKGLSAAPSSLSMTFDATNEYLHFAYPSDIASGWGLPSRIVDNNGYDQTFGATGSGADWEYTERTIVTPYWTNTLYFFTQGPTTVQGTFTFYF